MKNKKTLTLVVVALVAVVVGLTIVYATLSTNLSITFGSSADDAITQKSATWDVKFDATQSTVTGTAAGYSGVKCGDATVTDLGVTIGKTEFYTQGDSCTWSNITIKNGGTLNAKLNSFTWTQPTGGECSGSTNGTYVCGPITYKILDASTSSELAVNKTLDNQKDIKVNVKAELTQANSGSDISQYGGKVQLNWIQN